jgi:3-phenylpropionate/trans-cinnamate dioxygenase ferredoxin reductase subunit
VRRIVVLGASLGGLRTAQALRDLGFAGALTIVGREPHMPYDRPPLSKQFLEGAMTVEECTLPTDGLDAEWRLGAEAVRLDPSSRQVLIDDGRVIDYDGLVLATGASARPWPGAPLRPAPNVFTLRTLDDALALREAVAGRGCRIVVLGGGFVGCEVAATLRPAGHEIDVVDLAPWPMAPLGPTLGEYCAGLHRAHGVGVHTGAVVAGFGEDGDRIASVQLQGGADLGLDLLLVATGSVPNTGWLRDSGLEHDPGVVCDSSCSPPGHPEIVCVGDIATFPSSLVEGRRLRVEHWSNAVEGAMVAAQNLLGGPIAAFDPVPSFWSDQFGIKIQAVGVPTLSDETALLEGSLESRRFVMGFGRSGRLIAAVGFDSPRAIPRYRRGIQQGVAIT